jgi:hypothetical protein
MRSAPSFERYHAFCSEIGQTSREVALVTDDDAGSHTGSTKSSDWSASDGDSVSHVEERRHPDIPDYVFQQGQQEKRNERHEIPIEDIDVQARTPRAELLAWHYRLGHLPFSKIKQMAKRGDLPSYLSTCQVPKCAACLFGKATRRAWRTKAIPNAQTIPPATAPGAVVAMDQMISSTPGLIGQMKGFLTHQRYTATTVAVRRPLQWVVVCI